MCPMLNDLGAVSSKKIEQRYNSISESTVRIIFLGTPHRASGKDVYGNALATLATAFLNKPWPRFVKDLRVNSEAFMRLTTDFRFQLPNYRVYSFYEMKPIRILSTLVSNKMIPLLLSIDTINNIILLDRGEIFNVARY